MNFLKKLVSRFEPKYHYDYEFDESKYPDYPEDFKPNIYVDGRINALTEQIKRLFRSQLDATPAQRLMIQERIMTLNNRIRIFEIIKQQQTETQNIQFHYKKIDFDRYFEEA